MDTIHTSLDSGDENVFYSPRKRFETPGSLDFSPRKLSMKSAMTNDADKGSSSIMLSKDLNRPPSARSSAFRSAPSLAPPEPKRQSPNSHKFGRQMIVTSLEDDEIDPRTYVERWDTVESKGEFTFSRKIKPLQGHIKYVSVDYTPMGMPLSNSTSPINLSLYPMPPTDSAVPFYDATEYNPEGPTDEAVLLSVLSDEFEEDKPKGKVTFLSSLWTLVLAVIFGFSDEGYFEHYRWFRYTSTYGRELDATKPRETRIFREINLEILPDYVDLDKAMDIAQKYHRGKSGRPFVQNTMRSVDLEEGIELQTYKRHSYNPY